MIATELPRKLANGGLLIPVRLEAEDGTIGDDVAEIGPDHPEFQKWMTWLKRRGNAVHGTRKPGRAPRRAR